MTLENVFNVANYFVLPFWALMIVLPRWQFTQKVMDSVLPFVALALVYGCLFVLSIEPDQAELWGNPTLPNLAALFSIPKVMATGWVHYLVMDLFVGRWIYQQGVEKQLITAHSLALCLFAGPLGLLSHLSTVAIADFWRQKKAVAAES
ncbi:hypothetical protein Lepto7376_4191 [[Leptolyngbya] sp. PCC 7376]|uniref:ABA4-like family protein n=1 Tax=[Leptolyngbya] sp. PCC 7376 TaxID=111781 RepID=UPI00029EEFF7|nr:ABA4-like family protein [[Leptolyngbya] sp. PCC 7376]AFY40311.1 hypothetical protein Lepto7376_4191 [[Leptolyngbya] sp. PCC 7376]